MKILLLNHRHPPDDRGRGGEEIAELATALRERGHETRVLTSIAVTASQEPDWLLRRLRLTDEWNPSAWGNVEAHRRILLARSRLVDPENVHELARVVATFQPDVALLGDLAGVGGLGLRACLDHLGIPCVWRVVGDGPLGLCHLGRGAVEGLAQAFSRHAEGTFLAASEAFPRRSRAIGLTLRGRVELIPPWTTHSEPRTPKTTRDGDRLRVLTVGGISDGEGIRRAALAARHLIDQGLSNFEMTMCGRHEDSRALALVASEGLLNHVRFVDPRALGEHEAILSRHDVLVFPTAEPGRHVGVPFEAMARGCVPILVGDCEPAEWLVHEVHCLKAEPSPEGLARSLRSILSGAIDLGPIARRAREAAARDFPLGRFLPRIESFLEEAAGQNRPGGGDPGEVYRLALMAEQLCLAFLEESLHVG